MQRRCDDAGVGDYRECGVGDGGVGDDGLACARGREVIRVGRVVGLAAGGQGHLAGAGEGDGDG